MEQLGKNLKPKWKIVEFRSVVNDYGLVDVGYEGYKFTWSSRRKGNDLNHVRLDRAFVNSTWFTHFNLAWVLHSKISKSDHLAIVFKIERIGSGIPKKEKIEAL